jgi:peptidoglycan/LPS O-acetylase OafA/YrhL
VGTTPRSTGGVHWPELDGLRALAILLVLARHSVRPFVSEDNYQAVLTVGSFDLTPLMLNGWVGVDLFFVLSGFLIGRQALRGSDGIRRFWFRRALRILPAYWVCLAVIALWFTFRASWTGRVEPFLSHVVMLQDYTGSVFVPAFWSLGVEEKFYLLTPLLVLGLGRLRSTRGTAAILLTLWALPVAARAIAAAGDGLPIPYETYFSTYRSPFHLTCESLVVGFGIAWSTTRGRLRLVDRRVTREVLFWGGAVLLVCGLAPGLLLGQLDMTTVVWTPALIGLPFGAMLLSCVSGKGSYSRILDGAGWRPIATGSYCLYLTHMMVMPVAEGIGYLYPWIGTGSVTRSWLNFLPWYLLLSVTTAYALHRVVEQPALRWRDRQLASRSRPAPAAVSPVPS